MSEIRRVLLEQRDPRFRRLRWIVRIVTFLAVAVLLTAAGLIEKAFSTALVTTAIGLVLGVLAIALAVREDRYFERKG